MSYVKISLNTWAVNTDRKFPDHTKQSTTDAFKTAKKKQFKKQQKQLVIWLVIKLLIELWKFQKILNKIFKRQLQMSMIKNKLKKNTYLQKKYRKGWWSEINVMLL